MQMHHVRRGAGKPLFLVHGLGSSGQSLGDDPRRPGRRAGSDRGRPPRVRPDPPLRGEVSVATLTDAVASFIHEQGLAGVDTVGSSMGARMVHELARRGVGGTAVALDPGGFWSDGELRFSALFPDAQLHWFDRCGHFPHWDAPREATHLILSSTR